MLRKFVFFNLLVSIFYNLGATSNLIFGSKESTVRVEAGATFIFENSAAGIEGKIIKDSSAVVDGADVRLEGGFFIDGPNEFELTGTMSFTGEHKIVLDGSGLFSGKKGCLLSEIQVIGKNNKIEGGLVIGNDILLYDLDTSVSIDLLSSLKSDIYLNGGELYMSGNNLTFDDTNRIIGPGKVYLNGNKLDFGTKRLTFDEPLYFVNAGDIVINDSVILNSVWTFSGDNVVDGNNNLFYLEDVAAKIIVERGSSVLFKNIVLHGVHSENFFCMDNLCTITLQNVDVYFDADFTFSLGKFNFLNSAKFYGENKFIYNTTQQSVVLAKSSLVFDEGMTFSYDPGNMRKDLISFEDSFAGITLDGATIHATRAGLELIKGCLLVKHNSYLESEKTENSDEGISLGDGTVENDFSCKILQSSKLDVLSGSLKYKNVSPAAWVMDNQMTELNINSGCNLYLYQDLNLGVGTVNYKNNCGLYNVAGKKLTGTVVAVGYMNYGLID